MLPDRTPLAVLIVLVLGGLFSALVVFSPSRAAAGGDVERSIARAERKLDPT